MDRQYNQTLPSDFTLRAAAGAQAIRNPVDGYIDIRRVRNGWIVSRDGNQEYVFQRGKDVADYIAKQMAAYDVDADLQLDLDLEEATGGAVSTGITDNWDNAADGQFPTTQGG